MAGIYGEALMLKAALDTSGRHAVFCVRRGGDLIVDSVSPAVGRASAELMPFILAGLKEAGLALTDVSDWRVGMGPGSFSGIRSGAALVAGVCRGTGAACGGVPSSFAIASATPGLRIDVLHDGRRGEVICSRYHRDTLDAMPVLMEASSALAIADLGTDADIVRVMLADDPARVQVESEVGPVLSTALVPAAQLLYGDPGPLEPVYVRPAVFTQPKKPTVVA